MLDRFNNLRMKVLGVSVIGMLLLTATVLTYVLPAYEEAFIESQKQQIKAAVDIAFGIIEHYQDKAEKGEMSLEQAQHDAKAFLRKFRYNNTDYFFTYNFNSVVMAHGLDSSMEGKDRSESKDAVTGVMYVQEMTKIAKEKGEGYIQYYFPKEKGGTPISKISYVRGNPKWSWYVGTGVYQDVIKEAVATFRMKILSVFLAVFFLVSGISIWFSVNLTNKIREIVQSIRQFSSHVLGSIETVSGSGQNLSSSAAVAASSLQETVASLEEVTSMIKSNSSSAHEASNISQGSRDTAKQGEIEVQKLMDSMKEITSSSKKIEEIIDVIDDIAFQTNLLALNAAVEAARAGEQGKGFAVVADAVRNLAQRSASAAKDISVLIKDSVSKVENGSQAAAMSAGVLNQIVDSVKKVADLNGEIAAASSEQTTGIQQINSALNQLDRVSQGNAAASENISTNVQQISETMSGLSQRVDDLLVIVDGNKAA